MPRAEAEREVEAGRVGTKRGMAAESGEPVPNASSQNG